MRARGALPARGRALSHPAGAPGSATATKQRRRERREQLEAAELGVVTAVSEAGAIRLQAAALRKELRDLSAQLAECQKSSTALPLSPCGLIALVLLILLLWIPLLLRLLQPQPFQRRHFM